MRCKKCECGRLLKTNETICPSCTSKKNRDRVKKGAAGAAGLGTCGLVYTYWEKIESGAKWFKEKIEPLIKIINPRSK